MFFCFAVLTPCFAETVSADDVSIGVIKGWLSEKYGCKITEGGELIVRYTDEGVFLTGDAEKVFEGIYEY